MARLLRYLTRPIFTVVVDDQDLHGMCLHGQIMQKRSQILGYISARNQNRQLGPFGC